MNKGIALLRRPWATALCASLLTLVIQVLALAASHDHPFGRRSRNVSDFGTQYLPFHAQFRRMLGGDTHLSNLWFTWTGGGGVPFLPDYAYYLGGPLTFLVGLFPVSHVETAILVVSTLRVCLGAATMALLLRRLNPRAPWLVPGLLATAYACSSWLFDTSIYTPMWLDALWVLPLALLAMHWCVERRRTLPGILVFTLAVWCNFYTAVMVCFGCLVYLIGLLVETRTGWRARLATLLRAGVMVATGWLLMGWLLVPTLKALGSSVPVPPRGVPEVMHGIRSIYYWPRLLPVTEGYSGSPAMSIGSLGLVLALSLPFARHVARRSRWTWSVLVLLVLALSDTAPLLWVWNAFDVPQGNHFRFSFVLCALLAVAAVRAWPASGPAVTEAGVPSTSSPEGVGTLGEPAVAVPAADPTMRPAVAGAHRAHSVEGADGVATAWTGVSWPSVMQLLGAGVLLAPVEWLARPRMLPVLAVGTSARWFPLATWAVLVAVALLTRPLRPTARSVVRILAILVLVALWSAETLVGSRFTQRILSHRLGTMPITAGSDAIYHDLGDTAARDAGWPLHRVATIGDPGLPVFSYYNQGALLGMPAIGYYSSNMPVTVSSTYASLGAFIDFHGRMMREADRHLATDPVLATILSISDPAHVPGVALPTVRTVPAPIRATTGNVFDNRNTLLGARVYAPTGVRRSAGGAAVRLPLVLAAQSHVSLSLSCPAATSPTLQFDKYYGRISAASGTGSAWSTLAATSNVVQLPAGSRTVTLSPPDQGRLVSVACFDASTFQQAVHAAVAPTTLRLTPGHVSARFASPVNGTVVVSTTALPGWRCTADSRALPVQSDAGMLAVSAQSMDDLECRYREPGVVTGMAVSAGTLLGVLVLGLVFGRRSARRRAREATTLVDAPPPSGDAGASRATSAQSDIAD